MSERWLPISPVTGQIDAFEWKTPVAEIGSRPAADAEPVEDKPPSRPMIDVAPAPAMEPDRPQSRPGDNAAGDTEIIFGRPAAKSALRPASKPASKSVTRPAPMADLVVPITHVPDDPGPDVYPEPEPLPEQTSSGSGWKRLFQ